MVGIGNGLVDRGGGNIADDTCKEHKGSDHTTQFDSILIMERSSKKRYSRRGRGHSLVDEALCVR